MPTKWWLSSNPDLYPTPADAHEPTDQEWAELSELMPYRSEEDDPFTCPRCHADYPQGNPEDHLCMEASDV